MEQSAFEILAGDTLEGYFDAIEETLGNVVEAEFEGGILTIELAIEQGGGGHYVINRHAPNQQIWLSSPISGAAHFDYDEEAGQWVSSRAAKAQEQAQTLAQLLAGELTAATGIPFDLD